MKRLLITAICLLAALISVYARGGESEDPYKKEVESYWAQSLESDIRSGNIAFKIQGVITNILRLSNAELKKRGFGEVGAAIMDEWYQVHYNAVLLDNIGDHEALSAFLGKVHSQIEGIIGLELCRVTHIHDLYILNMTLKTILHPCLVDSIEYKRHFAGKVSGEVEFGLVPVLAYWVSYGVCVGGSFGTGFIYLCGMLGTTVEKAVCSYIAPPLSDYIWFKKCASSF